MLINTSQTEHFHKVQLTFFIIEPSVDGFEREMLIIVLR